MKVSGHSWLSSVVDALGTAAGKVGDAVYGVATKAEVELHDALKGAEAQRSAVGFGAGALEGFGDVPLDFARIIGGVLSFADPSNQAIAARVGIPLLRAFNSPGAVLQDIREQWDKDFAKEPAGTSGYAIFNPLGELARLDDKATLGPEVSFLSVPVPGTKRSLPVVMYTPPGVHNTKDIPIVYYLHGTPGSPGDFMRDGGKRALDAWFKAGHPPFILVEPDGDVPGLRDSEWLNAANGDANRQVERYLMKSVIPAVEGDQLRERKNRLVMGYSMGAYGAMNLALHHPRSFGAVASLEGYYHVDDTDGMLVTPQKPGAPPEIQDPGGPGLADPRVVRWNSPDQQVDRAKGMGVLLIGANQDIGVSQGESQRMSGVMTAHGIPHTLEMVPGGHLPHTLADQMTRLFRWIEAETKPKPSTG